MQYQNKCSIIPTTNANDKTSIGEGNTHMAKSNKEETRENNVDYVIEMTNDEYRMELDKIFDCIDDNRILRYFYIFVSEKLKRVL